MSSQQPSHTMPPQHQNVQPGIESDMKPLPNYEKSTYKASGKLKGKVALITGGDSGIGRAVALTFAKEGASIAIVYLNEHNDALLTQHEIEAEGVPCLLLSGDIGHETFCEEVIKQTIATLGGLNILVNNAAEQHPQTNITDITAQQLERTFKTNIFSMFYLTKSAIPQLKKGDSIINTTSVTAYRGSAELLDYSSTKGAVVSFTRSLSANLAKHGIRVNGVAPGPIWTPLIPSTFDEQKVSEFGANTPMQRPGQPIELAAGYVYLASDDSSYMSGQILHINGGEIVNG
ncbi:SDR family oxidoreductase [Paenibacillus taiwanensis]|uniref:SDR family oxidoreductase n=1 Tax=Paenibacillus taiwanensis TaxID=401638 RepID=UPI000420362F|nr:SDR family oxidoreductase [Paenibacillus taiwanensis]